jgi:hypothetical protein
MGKLLRILAVLFLVLSVAALTLGVMLFNKRELLKGRTQKLENALIALGSFIESEAPTEQLNPAFPAKDTSDCTAEMIETPNKSEFWKTYPAHLEQQDRPTLDLGARKGELMTYYMRDPITLKIMTDEMGYKVTKGKGTMQYLLDEVIKRAEEQHGRLNATRNQLKLVREELVSTIDELNRRKTDLRSALHETAQLKDEVARLEQEAAALKTQASALEQEVAQAKTDLEAKQQQLDQLNEVVKEKDEKIADQRKQIDALRNAGTQAPASGTGLSLDVLRQKIDPGVKGSVAAVNESWSFVVLDLDDAFLRNVLGPDLSGAVPPVELMIKRPDAAGTFVTKVRLMQVKRDQKLGIADVLTDWQQLPVQEGVIVFY